MGNVSVCCIESRVAVNSLLGLASYCTEEIPEPEPGKQIPSAAGALGVCIQI